MLSIILLIIFIPVCLLLILIVLLQAGKGQGLAGAFGGTGSQTFLGARGTSDFLSKFTIYLAIAFMALSLLLSITYGREKVSIQKEEPAAADAEVTAEETPAGTEEAPVEVPTGTQPPAEQTPQPATEANPTPPPPPDGN